MMYLWSWKFSNLTLDFLNQFKKDVNILCFFDDNKNLHGQIIKGIKINPIANVLETQIIKLVYFMYQLKI